MSNICVSVRRSSWLRAAQVVGGLLGSGLAAAQIEPPGAPVVADPTVADDAIRAVLRENRVSGAATAPQVLLRGLIVGAGGLPDAVVEVDGDLVRLRKGLDWTTRSGFRLLVTELTNDGALVDCAEPKASIRLDFDNAARRGRSADPGPGAEDRLAVVDFREIPIERAARLIADQAGMNVVASQGAASQRVSMYLRDVDVTQAIRALCEAYQLWYREEPGSSILRISTVDEYRRDLTDIQEEETATFTLNYPNVYDVGIAIRDLFGRRVQLRTSRGQDDVLTDLADRLARFDVLDGRTQGFGQNNTFGAAAGFGNESGAGQFGGSIGGRYGGTANDLSQRIANDGQYGSRAGPEEKASLTGTLSAEDIRKLEELLELQGGATPEQVSEEVAKDYEAPIHVTVAGRQNKLFVRTSDRVALAQIKELVREIDVPTALVLLEIRILSISLEEGAESFFEYQWGNNKDDSQGAFSTGDIAAPLLGLGPGGTALRGGDLIFQYVDASFGARLQLLESENRVRTLATPVLLTANNEVSRLFIGREVPLNRSFTGGQTLINQTTSTTATGTTSIEFRPVGTTLLVTPSINSDRSVTLRIVQESSNVDSQAEVLVPSGTDFEARTVDVVSSQTVSGTIVAQDDLAVAFGGMIEHGTLENVSGVPVLRHIPLLGVLFEQRVERNTQREIVIVVKPYVIGTPASCAATSVEALVKAGVDLDALNTDPATGEVISRKGPFTNPQRFRVHGVAAPRGGKDRQ